MKKTFLFFALITVSLFSTFIVKAQNVKSYKTFEQAQQNMAELELELSQVQFNIISKNYETYYKDFLSLTSSPLSGDKVKISIVSIKPENKRIIKRLLIASEVKEIQFSDKKATIDEYFGI